MPLTEDFKATVQARVARDPKIPEKILARERGMPSRQQLLETGKALLRDYIAHDNRLRGVGQYGTDARSRGLRCGCLDRRAVRRRSDLLDLIAHLQRVEGACALHCR